jgi:hypothetical protein
MGVDRDPVLHVHVQQVCNIPVTVCNIPVRCGAARVNRACKGYLLRLTCMQHSAGDVCKPCTKHQRGGGP